MNSRHDKPKRWRPQFSVRTLTIVVTLACCYAACWGPTKGDGVADLAYEYESTLAYEYESTDAPFVHSGPVGVFHTSAAAPLIVRQDEVFLDCMTRRYYFWCFGFVAKLPYEREIEVGFVRLPLDFDFSIDSLEMP